MHTTFGFSGFVCTQKSLEATPCLGKKDRIRMWMFLWMWPQSSAMCCRVFHSFPLTLLMDTCLWEQVWIKAWMSWTRAGPVLNRESVCVSWAKAASLHLAWCQHPIMHFLSATSDFLDGVSISVEYQWVWNTECAVSGHGSPRPT